MRVYTIYLDRIEMTNGNSQNGPFTLEEILISLSQDLLNLYYSLPLGKGTTYRRWSYLIDDLLNVIDFNKSVDETSVVGILRNSISFIRRKFPNFQIIILNHV